MRHRLVVLMALLITSLASADMLSTIAGEAAQKALAEAQDEAIDAILDDVQSLNKDDSIRVIVMPIERDWTGYFSDRLIEKATQRTNIKLIDREHLKDILGEQQKGQSGMQDNETVARAGKILGANVLVYGKIVKKTVDAKERKAVFEIAGKVVDVETARILLAKRFRIEKEIEGEFSWEKLNKWIQTKGEDLKIIQ